MSRSIRVKIPPFTIIRDTREQNPWLFESLEMGTGRSRQIISANTVDAALSAGDYSLLGLEHRIAVERKSAIDLFATLSRGRQRFIRELARLNELDFSAVVIESTWTDCMLHPPERSKMQPSAVNGTIIAFQQRFPRTHWWWMPGRYAASKQAWKILSQFWKDHYQETITNGQE